MKKTVYTKLAVALSFSLVAGSALAQESKPTIIKPSRIVQTFCEVNQFTGAKRQYTVKKWDASTQFDVLQGMKDGSLVDMPCVKVKLEKNTYCFTDNNGCWIEYDIANWNDRDDSSTDQAALNADLAEGAQE